jgi:hypothetical protein
VPGTEMYKNLAAEHRLLDTSASVFADGKESYAASSHRAFFQPKKMSTQELEGAVMELNRKLTALKEIYLRSKTTNLAAFIAFATLNMGMRKEYLALKRTMPALPS